MNSSIDATQADEEQNPCLSSAERDSNQVIDDSSGVARTGSEAKTSLHGCVLGNKVPELDFAEPIPRSFTTSWSSILAGSISILSTVPFLVLACLLARVEGDAVDQSSQRNLENSIKVVSGPFYLTLFTRAHGKWSTVLLWADPSILYLINTSSSFLLDPSSILSGNLSTVPAHDIGYRLGQLLNTYQINSQAFESITSGIPNEDVGNITAAAQTTSTKEVYAINKP
ncbi:hypothetical protein LA080_006590 [Diaporthe eres]|nr:hypothetical protein LA080_006590 [Diaporthe eres]